MFVGKPLSFFRSISEYSLAFIAEWQINGGRNFLADRGVALDLFADRFYGGVRTQEAISQGFVFAQQSQQEMFSLYIRRAELAGFITRKEDDAPCFFRVTLKHISPRIPPERKASALRSGTSYRVVPGLSICPLSRVVLLSATCP